MCATLLTLGKLNMKNQINVLSIHERITNLLTASNLTRMAQIQLLSELLNNRINHCINDGDLQVPDYVSSILIPDNFPMGSIELKRELMNVMPPMKSQESKQRKALRLINQMKECGTLMSRGRGIRTEYFLTE